VRYILTNHSRLPVKGYFAVESLFSLPGETPEERAVELVTKEKRENIKVTRCFYRSGGVSCVQITDCLNKVSLVTEPNEHSGFMFTPIVAPGTGGTEHLLPSLASILFWAIDLPSGMQTEKTINLAIKTTRQEIKAPFQEIKTPVQEIKAPGQGIKAPVQAIKTPVQGIHRKK
jgi:hypothetical protein